MGGGGCVEVVGNGGGGGVGLRGGGAGGHRPLASSLDHHQIENSQVYLQLLWQMGMAGVVVVCDDVVCHCVIVWCFGVPSSQCKFASTGTPEANPVSLSCQGLHAESAPRADRHAHWPRGRDHQGPMGFVREPLIWGDDDHVGPSNAKAAFLV